MRENFGILIWVTLSDQLKHFHSTRAHSEVANRLALTTLQNMFTNRTNDKLFLLISWLKWFSNIDHQRVQLNITLFLALKIFWPESTAKVASYVTGCFLEAELINKEEFFLSIECFFPKFNDFVIYSLRGSCFSCNPSFYRRSGLITTPLLPKILWELLSLSESLLY